jgi:prevent-host-death family protein
MPHATEGDKVTCLATKLVDKLVYMAHQTTVGVFDAKTHLNGLLKRVSKGETIRITRRGVPIAKLVPADDGEREDPDEVVRQIRELRKGANLGKTSIRELINAGRHY